jgi:hypothetical protein
MTYPNDKADDAIRKGFREAEQGLRHLHTHFETRDGKQGVKDLQELLTNGIERLCRIAGIASFQTRHIFQHAPVRLWMEEVACKKLIMTLLLKGKGPEVLAISTMISARFGEQNGIDIANAAMFLADELNEAVEQKDMNRITAIMRATFVASPKLEEYHKRYTSGSVW